MDSLLQGINLSVTERKFRERWIAGRRTLGGHSEEQEGPDGARGSTLRNLRGFFQCGNALK